MNIDIAFVAVAVELIAASVVVVVVAAVAAAGIGYLDNTGSLMWVCWCMCFAATESMEEHWSHLLKSCRTHSMRSSEETTSAVLAKCVELLPRISLEEDLA